MAHIRKNIHDIGKLNSANLSALGTKLDTIATNTANINLNVDTLEVNTDTLETLQTANNATATSVLAKNTEIETTNNAILAKNTEIETTADAILAKNTQLETELGHIKTAVQLIDNAVDGNYLNVNQNIAGTDVDGNSGNKSAQTQRVCIATDDIPIALVNTKLDHLSDNLDTLETTANAIQSAVEGTLTVGSHQVSNNGTFAVQATCSGTVTANLSATDNAVIDAILAKNTEIETTANAIQSAVEGTLTVGSHQVSNNGTFAVQATCSGTVTANLSATDNAVLDNILAKNTEIETTANAIQSAVEGTLTVGSHQVSNNGTFATQVSSSLPAGDNNIGNVDIASALPAGTNAIGKLSANSGVDIGDVDVTSISAGTNRIGMVAIKGNENADGSGTERHLLCDSGGRLQVDVISGGGSTDVSALSTHAKQDTIIGHLDGVEGKLDHLSDNLDTLETTANAIQSAVEGTLTVGSHQVSNNGTFAVQATCSGTVTANLSATDNAVLDNILAKNTEIETTADAILAKNTEIETTADAILAKNTELETELGHIKTAVQLIDNAVDGNYLNVNQNIAGTDVDGNSGNKSAQTQRVCIATDDIPIALVNTNLVAVGSALGDINDDNNDKLDHLSGDLDTLNGKIDTLTNRIKLANSDTHIAVSLEDVGGLDTKLDHLSDNLDTIETSLTRIEPKEASATYLSGGNVAHGNAVAGTIVDTDGYRYMTIFAKASNTINVRVQYSNSNSSGGMVSLPQALLSTSVNGIPSAHMVLEHPARYVRFVNFSGSTINALTLYYQLSN